LTAGIHQRLEDVPVVARYVAYVLAHRDDPLTTTELAAETGLHQRKVRHGLEHLRDLDAFVALPVPGDARRRRYGLDADMSARK
jgi:hypothetical protein